MVLDAVGLLEKRLSGAGFARVAGADEVGRGALAGPLVAAAVILPEGFELPGLRDSKMCTPGQRRDLAEAIRASAIALAIVRVRPEIIDRKGLNPANVSALRRALHRLPVRPDYALVDGFPLPRMPYPTLAVKKGDAVSRNVAAASIVAKVYRDSCMRRYHRRHPEYGWASNVGYGTRHHWDALRRLGPSELHRLSFRGVLGWDEEDSVPEGAGGGGDGGEVRHLPQPVGWAPR